MKITEKLLREIIVDKNKIGSGYCKQVYKVSNATVLKTDLPWQIDSTDRIELKEVVLLDGTILDKEIFDDSCWIDELEKQVLTEYRAWLDYPKKNDLAKIKSNLYEIIINDSIKAHCFLAERVDLIPFEETCTNEYFKARDKFQTLFYDIHSNNLGKRRNTNRYVCLDYGLSKTV